MDAMRILPHLSAGAASAAFLLLTPSLSQAQTASATTDPVGFITLSVPAASGPTGASLSFKSLGLARAVEYQGSAEVVGSQSLRDEEAVWTDGQFNTGASYYVEITGPAGGAGVGSTYDITGTNATTKTITVAQPLAANIAAGATFRIRKHWTIASVFGANNEAGLQGGTASTADTVRVYNGDGSYETYYYSTGGLAGSGWRTVNGGSTPKGGAVLYPDDGMLITRTQSTPLNLVLMGAVKTGQTSTPILAGMNIVGNPYAAPMTLGNCNLYTANPSTGLTPGTASTADQVHIYNGSGYDIYFYSTGGLPGVGWRKVSGGKVDQANVQIPVGTSIIVLRRSNGPFNWVVPQHPAAL